MARVFHVDGSITPMAAPANGVGYTIAEINAAMGLPASRFIQHLPLGGGQDLLFDEDAKMRASVPPTNRNATEYARAHGALFSGDRIVGPACCVAVKDGEWIPIAVETTGERQRRLAAVMKAFCVGMSAGEVRHAIRLARPDVWANPSCAICDGSTKLICVDGCTTAQRQKEDSDG